MRPLDVRPMAAYSTLALFIATYFVLGLQYQLYTEKTQSFLNHLEDPSVGFDSIDEESKGDKWYVPLRTLYEEDLSLDKPDHRVFIVGDIHGMHNSLEELLNKVSFNTNTDILLHVGDLIAKSGVSQALHTLDFFASRNISGALGNHDDLVVRWRIWINWVLNQKGGERWLEKMEKKSSKQIHVHMNDESMHGNRHSKWKIPNKWDFGTESYWIARKMTNEHFKYLSNLPLALYLPSLHTYIVHAGLLPSDPTRSPISSRQPLARIPRLPPPSKDNPKLPTHPTDKLRLLQELAVLRDIPQNQNPWVLTNMRSIRFDGTVSKKKKDGVPWSRLWNIMMSSCDGFEIGLESNMTDVRQSHDDEEGKNDHDKDPMDSEEDEDLPPNLKPKVRLPCHPLTTVYGHAAARGLDIKRWSIGLDTGCIYGRRLTALVLTSDSQLQALDDVFNPTSDDYSIQSIKFGERGRARLVGVKCPLPS